MFLFFFFRFLSDDESLRIWLFKAYLSAHLIKTTHSFILFRCCEKQKSIENKSVMIVIVVVYEWKWFYWLLVKWRFTKSRFCQQRMSFLLSFEFEYNFVLIDYLFGTERRPTRGNMMIRFLNCGSSWCANRRAAAMFSNKFHGSLKFVKCGRAIRLRPKWYPLKARSR